jgi:uncharacterized protein YqeY
MRTRDTNTLNPLKSFLTAHQSSSKDVLSKKPNIAKTHFESDIFLAPLLHKQIAKRRDSLEGYKAHGRDDLAEKEAFEITVLERYLPYPQTREDDVRRMTVETIEIMRSNGDGPNDPGNTSLNKIYEYIKRDEENREALSVLHADQGMVRRVIAETVRDLSDRIDGAPQRNVERLKPVEEDTLTKGRYQ